MVKCTKHLATAANPGYTHEHMLRPEMRLANAAEFSIYQLGRINQSLARLVSILEKRTP